MRRASLNHIYRLVWSEREQAFIAVAENVRTKGKSSGICRSLAALVGVGLSAFSYADGVVVAPGSGVTNIYTAPNGVPVVNIDKANAAGLSHNKYLDYNVGTNGLILNNANSSQMTRQSQLAGQIMANPNLAAEAKVILNEVVTTNRSTLRGYTEVLGGKADVILANPYGVTCNGCGFINTDRVTLTTGTPNISNTGALSGFTINGGDIFIDGAGLDGMNQSYFDIVTRTFRMNAQINARDLKIITGTNNWDYITQTASAITPTGTAPTFAFDSSLLGGMYSNRIFIQATEAGVGVKMLGEAATTADDFTISAAGKIDIRSKVSAERNLSLTSTSNAVDAIGLTDANLSSKNNLMLTANNGGATISGGLLVASNDLTGVLGSLTDNANTTAVTDNNKRYAKGAANLTVTNATNISGTNWGSAAASNYNVGSLNVGTAGATLYAGTSLGITANSGNLALATAAIKSTDNLTLTSTNGSISTTAGAGQGIQATAGNLTLTSGNGFSNAGVITADAGSVTVRSNGTVSNSGTLHAATTMDIADKNNAATENVSNTGTLLVDGALTAKATNFSNTGSLQGTAGVNLSAASLTNSGTFIASNTAGKSGTFNNLTTLNNTGTLQSAEDLTFNVSGTVTNSGKLLATHDLAVLAGNSALAIFNALTGVIQANNALTMTGSNATFNTQAGTLLGNNAVNLTLSNLDNSGTLQSNAGLTYAIGNALINSGTLLAKDTLTGSSANLTNSGAFQANQGATITATSVDNSGTFIASNTAGKSGVFNNVTSLNNSGTLQSAEDLSLNVAGTLANTGKLLASHDFSVQAGNSALAISNALTGIMQANNALNITGNNAVFNTQAGKILANTVALALSNLDNSGVIQSEAGMNYTVANTLTNSGTVLAKTTLSGSSVNLENSGTLQANQGATINATNAINNSGVFVVSNNANNSGTLTAATLSNSGAGSIQSAHHLTINLSGNALSNSSKILADDDLTITSTGSGLTIANNAGGFIQAGTAIGDDLKINGTAVTLNNAGGTLLGNTVGFNVSNLNNGGAIQSETSITYAIDNALTNSGTWLAKTTVSGNSASLTNSGTLEADQGTTITAANINNSGLLIASSNAGKSGTFNNVVSLTNTGTLQSLEDLTFNITGTLANSGKLLAANNLSVQAGSSALAISNTSPGWIQAGNLLSINNSNGTFDTQSGTVLGNTVGLKLASLNNSGILQSNTDLTYTISNDLTNSGTLLAKNTLSGNSANLINSGTLHADQGATITASSINNSGKLIASNAVGKSGIFNNVASFNNNGTVQSADDLILNVSSSLSNSGNLLAVHDLTLLSGNSAVAMSNTSSGIIQANNALNISGSNSTFNNQAGKILGKTVDFFVYSLNNSGVLQSNEKMTSTVGNTFTNSGTVLAKDSLYLSAKTLTNSSTLQADRGATVFASTAVNNTGSLILSSGSIYGATLQTAILSNSGTGNIQSAHDLGIILNGNSLGNAGKILADDDLTITSNGAALTVENTGGFIQAGTGTGDDLTITGNSVTLNNNANSTLLGDRLAFTTSALTNSGTVQGGAGSSVINVANTLTNNGLFSLANSNAGSGTITANSIINNNNGVLQSAGAANLNVAIQLANSGNLLTDGTLTVRGTNGKYVVTNASIMQSGGLLDIKGQSNSKDVDITVAPGALMLGGSVDINANLLKVNDNGMLSSSGAMTLGLNTLSFDTFKSRIVGSTDGNATTAITLRDDFSNPGAVFSAGTLTFNGAALTNSSTGGISALKDMNVTSSSNLVNQGLFYTGGNMSLSVAGKITNSSTAGSGGGINSDHNVSTQSNDFNNSGDINATNISVIARNSFYNGLATIPTISEDWTNAVYGARKEIKNSGGFDCNIVGDFCNQYWVYERTITVNQKLSSALPATKPQMLASGTMTINWGAGGGQNVAGILSANTLNLSGSGSFVNKDVHLETVSYGQHWMIDMDDCTVCNINYNFRYATASQYFDVGSLGTNGGEVGWGPNGEWQELSRAGSRDSTKENAARDAAGKVELSRGLLNTSGAGIFANTLNYSGGGLTNYGSAYTPSVKKGSQDGATATNLANGATGTTGAAGTNGTSGTNAVSGASGTSAVGGASTVNGTTATNGASGATGISAVAGASGVTGTTLANGNPAVVFNGLVISLPTNPNGFFVVSKNPQSKYLVETNPLFNSGQDFIGSDYLAKRLGINTDQVNLRLGNAAYENYVIRQQLIDQTGRNIINGYASEKSMIENMYASASTKSSALGLSWGKPLSADQIGKLTEDIVWMVETVVDGRTVLAPVVYLSKATKEGIQTGAVIAATDANIKTDSLTNTGGTIAGSKTLGITSKGDITNTSGRIQGGDVSLTSTTGSIVNKTVGGTTENPTTSTLGTTASIQATGNLALDAKKDIKVIGAEVKAAGDASLAAGENVTFDTVVNKTATNSTSSSINSLGQLFTGGEVKNSSTVTTTNTGSTLETGGNLKISSGKDTTIASSKVNTGGNLNIDAKGDLNIIDRHDKVETNTSSSTGNQGSFFTDSKSETTKTVDTTSKGSSITVGGNADLTAGKTVTLKGSDLKVTGDAAVTGTDVKVLAGENTHDSTTVTKSHTFMGNSNTESGSSSGTGSDAKTEKNSLGGDASASVKAEAEAHSSSNFDIVNDKTTTTVTKDVTHTGSTISAGNLKITAKKDVTLEGADIEAKKNVSVSGETVNITTAVDTHSTTTTVDEKAFRLSSDNSAKAEAGASAEAGTTKMSASAQASARAEANSDNFSGYVHNEITTTEKSTTNKGTSIKSGGDTSLTATNDLTLKGAKVDAGGNVDLTSTKGNINILAAHDTEDRTSNIKTETIGLYGTGNAQAGAEATAAAKVGKVGVEANADATATGGVGFQYSNKTQDETSGSSTAVVSSIKSGGNLTRTANSGKITDEGTKIDVGGDLTQSAKEIEMKAAKNTEYSTSNESNEKFRIGVYGEAGASAQAEAKASLATGAGADAEAHAIGGVQLSNQYSKSSESSNKSTAVVSNVKVGGNVNSTSTGKTTLEGTNITTTKGDVNITASELEYKAARDTESSSSNSLDTSFSLKAGGGVAASGGTGGGGAGPQVQGGLKFSAEGENKNSDSSTATAGSITSGGKLNIKTTEKDLKLEGTNLTSAGDMSLTADKGSVVVDAARSTSSSSGTGWDAGMNLSGEVGAGKKSGGVEVSGGYKDSDKAKSTGVAANIKSGGNLNVTAGKDAKFEGTALEAAGDAKVDAKGNVEFNAVKNTETSKKFDVNADISVGGNAKNKSVEGSVEAGFSYENNNKVTYNAASIKSGGKSSVNAGGDVTLQGDVKIGTADAKGNIVNDDKAITAGGTVKKVETKNVDEKTKFGLEVAVDFETKGKSNKEKAADNTKAADSHLHDAKIDQAKTTKAASDAKTDNYKKADDHLDSVKKTHDDNTKAAETKLSDAKKDLSDAQSKLDKATSGTEEHTKAKQELDAAQTKAKDAEKQVTDTKTAGEDAIKQAADKAAELKKQADTEHDTKVSAAEQAVKDKEAAIKDAKTAEDALKKPDVATTKVDSLEKTVTDAKQKLADAETNSNNKNSADAVKELDNLKKDSESANNKIADTKNEATTLKDDAGKLQKTADDKIVAADKSKTESISQAKTAADNKISDATKTAETEKSKIDSDSSLTASQKTEAKKKVDADLESAKKQATTEKDQAINKAEDEHKQAKTEADTLSKQATDKTKQADEKVATAEKDAADKKSKLDAAEKDREQAQKDLSDAKKQLDELSPAQQKLEALSKTKADIDAKVETSKKQAAEDVVKAGLEADTKKKQAEADKQQAIANKDKAAIKKADAEIAAADKAVADAKEKAFSDVRKAEDAAKNELKEANRVAVLEHSKEPLAATIKASDEKIANADKSLQTAKDSALETKNSANKTVVEKETAQQEVTKKLDDANSAKQKAEDAVKQNPSDVKAQEDLKKANQAVDDADKAKKSADSAVEDAKKAKVDAEQKADEKVTEAEKTAQTEKEAAQKQKDAAAADMKVLTDKKAQLDEAKTNAATQLAEVKTKADQSVKDAEAKVTAATTPAEKAAAEKVLEKTKAKAEADTAAAEKLHDDKVAEADRKYDGEKKEADPTNYSIMDDIKKGGDKGVELTLIKQVVEIPKDAKSVSALTEDGEPLPDWVKFDSKTGTFSGLPPKDYEGDMKVIIKAVQEDGTVKSIPVEIGKRKD